MMCLEFRHGPRSIYGKNGPTPATQFAMIMGFHLSPTALTQHLVIPVIPNQGKLHGFSFGVGLGRAINHFNVGEVAAVCTLPMPASERDATITGNTPSRCNPPLRRRFLATVGTTHHRLIESCPNQGFFIVYLTFAVRLTEVHLFDVTFSGRIVYWLPIALRRFCPLFSCAWQLQWLSSCRSLHPH